MPKAQARAVAVVVRSSGSILTLPVLLLALVATTGAALVDDRSIAITSAGQLEQKRRDLVHYIWGTNGFPARRLPDRVLTNVLCPVKSLTNLARVDELRVHMAAGLEGLAYHFVPKRANHKLVVLHHGHACTLDDDPSPGDVGFGMQRTIHALLREGYGVLGVFMPHMRPGDCSGGHDAMFSATERSPLRYFLEPTALSLNYLQSRSRADAFPEYNDMHMAGLSGGGWTTTVYAAVDPRIRCSFPVAGTIPLYLRTGGSVGDREQYEPSFYSLAGYPDLYALGSHGSQRKQVQVLVRRDDCCFGERQHDTAAIGASYSEAIRSYEARVQNVLKQIGPGSFRVEIDDTAPSHMISRHAIKVILEELR